MPLEPRLWLYLEGLPRTLRVLHPIFFRVLEKAASKCVYSASRTGIMISSPRSLPICPQTLCILILTRIDLFRRPEDAHPRRSGGLVPTYSRWRMHGGPSRRGNMMIFLFIDFSYSVKAQLACGTDELVLELAPAPAWHDERMHHNPKLSTGGGCGVKKPDRMRPVAL